MRHMFQKGLLLLAGSALTGIVMLAAAGCGTTTTSTPPTTATPTSTSAGQGITPTPVTSTPQQPKIGETVTVKQTWQITAVSFRPFTPPNRTPAAGMKYVALELDIKNVSTTAQSISATGSFTIKDAAGKQYQQVYVGGISLAFDDTLNANDTRHGVVAFEVPAGTNAFAVSFGATTAQPAVEYVRWNVSL